MAETTLQRQHRAAGVRGPGRCVEGESDAIKVHSCPLSRGSSRGCAVLPSLQDHGPSCVCTGNLQQARLRHQATFGRSGKSGHGSAPTSVTQMTQLIGFSESKPDTGKGPASHPQQSPDKGSSCQHKAMSPGMGCGSRAKPRIGTHCGPAQLRAPPRTSCPCLHPQ